MTFEGKIWWVVGASTGLGAAIAKELSNRGADLILSARSADKLEVVAEGLQNTLILPLDVTDPASVKVAASQVGKIDGVIYCVGQYEPMTAQNWDPEVSVSVAEANYVGALRVLGHIVPDMAESNQGHVVLIGSLSGHVGLPGAIGYGSSKAALMHLGSDMAFDLRKSDVVVQVINPGYIRTRLSKKNDFNMPQVMEPTAAAIRVLRAMERGKFSTSFPRPFSLIFVLGKFLPKTLFQRLFG